MKIIGRLICYVVGHRRGKRIKRTGLGPDGKTDTAIFQCPRCGRIKTRKVKVAS